MRKYFETKSFVVPILTAFAIFAFFAVNPAFPVGIEIPSTLGALATTVAASTGKVGVLEGKVGTTANVLDLAQATQANATNTQVMTVTHGVMRWASINAGDGETNTVTLADPGAGITGRTFILYNAGTSNNLAIAKTGNFVSTALDIAPGDIAIITAVATNLWAGK
jgi:hypothetical protein